MLESIGNTIREEFSDVPDAAAVTRIVIRLSFAAILGGILGYEREAHGKSAGMRTHMLVAIGSALFILIPQQAGACVTDLTRIIQGLVTGIGFLGAGTIIKRNDAQDVKGLTTAAGIWLTAAVGIAIGMGREVTAVVSTLLALGIFAVMPRICRFERGANESKEPDTK